MLPWPLAPMFIHGQTLVGSPFCGQSLKQEFALIIPRDVRTRSTRQLN